ncbi:hypothetical protein [Pseudomonas xionganensis]|uniref:Ribosomal protein S3AE n=1 Tax=Pseudomonas xionganensis TaxID=2654845 RepID=A0A6I4KVF1_9PSED|nr:hypothetical protein [Pseudomonas xionganensis]MVW76067.1 hypothetical protein [Pseudomonas xionganensis]
MNSPLPIRNPCPPGVCDCSLEQLPQIAGSDLRILMLNRKEEKRLLDRLETIQSLDDLKHMQQRMQQQLGIQVSVAPGANEVRSMRGIDIQVMEQPGLCRKTRQSIRTAIRRSLERRPEIAYDLLNAHDLFRDL